MTPTADPGDALEPQAERFLAALREGDADFLAAALAAEPRLATAPHEPHGWTPLIYLCASPLHDDDPAAAERLLRCARLLLDHGADPNSYTLWNEGDGESRLPALYHACVAGNAPVVQLLLERGAEPNDGESIYHAAELDHRACLELLVSHGADPSGRHPRWNNTPLYFLAGYRESQPGTEKATAGMRWLLEHGADPNVTSYEHAETPLHAIAAHGRGPAVAEMLLAHGAEIDQRRGDGRTAYTLAVRAGNTAMAAYLRERGAATGSLSPVDELLGACMAGDGDAARALLARHPGLMAELAEEDRQLFAFAAGEGRESSVRLMAELGFDLAWEGGWGGTPLHAAAWFGHPSLVRVLIALGAPLDVRDRQFGSSPLAWAAHGSANCRQADDDYRAIVDLLIDAGAEREPSFNRQGEAPEQLASPGVAERLAARGFASV
jgi:ankyrin repeat protein